METKIVDDLGIVSDPMSVNCSLRSDDFVAGDISAQNDNGTLIINLENCVYKFSPRKQYETALLEEDRVWYCSRIVGPRGDFPITGGSLNSETETITYRDFGPSGSYDDGELVEEQRIIFQIGISVSKKKPKPAASEHGKQEEMGTSINNTGGSFVIEIGGYGGEVVLGTITETQYKYWKFESEEELDQHISDWDNEMEVPDDLSLQEWNENDDIVHTSGPEFSNEGSSIEVKDSDGSTIWDSNCDPQALVNLGVKVVEEEEVYISNLPKGYYFFGRAFEKGIHFSSSVKSEQFDLKKLELHYRNVDGWVLLESVCYDGETILNGDSSTITNSSSFELHHR